MQAITDVGSTAVPSPPASQPGNTASFDSILSGLGALSSNTAHAAAGDAFDISRVESAVWDPSVAHFLGAGSSLASAFMPNQVSGMAGNVAQVLDSPTASNIFKAGHSIAPDILPAGSAGAVGNILNVVDNPTAGNIAAAGLSVASALGSPLAASLAGPVGAIASFIDHPTVENGLMTAASILCPPLGIIAGIGSLISGLFSGPTIPDKQLERNRAVVSATMSEVALETSGGSSISTLQSAVFNVMKTDKNMDHKFVMINHIRCLIAEESGKSTNPELKTALDKLVLIIEQNNPYSRQFFGIDDSEKTRVLQANNIDAAFDSASKTISNLYQ